ncbi:hypothetical protein HL658_33655 [Azospirillum sp. RWY-5-1]|uniref:Sulfotransferase n=1 Tax=Azospirillum oleiclasticum TaxID=2735135 RepID=A0ABX2TMV4_9PROT|nr:hypothetical protein [Azospirillum oleiclasticum]NYZ17515.1 hypothetical protein [Azospirillum oleiclasticum]NYZ24893.1 hypothetical protein [Azospirillum oleiclasticum]
MTEKTHFIIGGVGRTATQWLTRALNRHPHILAAHGADWRPNKASMADPDSNHARREAVLDWLLSGQILDIDRYFSIFNDYSEEFCGNVHGIDIIGPYLYPQNFKTRLRICHVTRHPLPRIRSMVRKCRAMGQEHPRHREMMSDFYTGQVGKIADLLERHGVAPQGEDEENFVSCLLLIMNSDAAFLRTTAPVFRMEELTTRLECFGTLLHHVTAGRLRASATEIEGMMALAPVDRLGEPDDHARIMEEWADWQRKLFRDYLERTDLRAIYTGLGYDLPC